MAGILAQVARRAARGGPPRPTRRRGVRPALRCAVVPDELDVCGIGSALVGVLVEATVEQVTDCGLVKGSMQLMDLAAADAVHARVPGGIERSGGSVANTAAGLASLGARAGFIGKVADDRFGNVFAGE